MMWCSRPVGILALVQKISSSLAAIVALSWMVFSEVHEDRKGDSGHVELTLASLSDIPPHMTNEPNATFGATS